MRIALQKKDENIIEYLLYMYQIEDLARAYDLDIDRIQQNLIDPNVEDPEDRLAYRDWYTHIIQSLKRGGHEKTGHMAELEDIHMELFYLHNMLLTLTRDDEYNKRYRAAQAHLEIFKRKSDVSNLNDIQVAISALYMKLLLRLKGESIGTESEEGFDSFGAFLGYLAAMYKRMQEGQLNFQQN